MRSLLIALFAVFTVLSASAQKVVTVNTSADEIVHLWNNTTAKHSNCMEKDELIKSKYKVYNTSSTELYIFTPPKQKATGYTVVIYPGGGYRYLSFPTTFPEWLRDNGITAVVVKYRLPNYGHSDAMLEDAIGAIEYMRKNAEKYNIVAQYSYEGYPANPNGSDFNVAALASANGRHVAMMPHPERAIFPWQCATYPANRLADDVTPWIEIFRNAYNWVAEKMK